MTWERRRALRYGSEHVAHHQNLESALNGALQEIVAMCVSKGEDCPEGFQMIDLEKRTIYYNVYPEEA